MEDTEQNRRRVFLSHSKADHDFTVRLAEALRQNGVATWVDDQGILPGNNWDREIEQATRITRTTLVILSPDAVDSEPVRDEIEYALNDKDCVVPIIYRECEVPLRLNCRKVPAHQGRQTYRLCLRRPRRALAAMPR